MILSGLLASWVGLPNFREDDVDSSGGVGGVGSGDDVIAPKAGACVPGILGKDLPELYGVH